MPRIEAKCTGDAIEIGGKRFNLEELVKSNETINNSQIIVDIQKVGICKDLKPGDVCLITRDKCLFKDLVDTLARKNLDNIFLEDDDFRDSILEEDPYGPNGYND